MSGPKYFPAITIREAECKALSKLAGPTRDNIFPIVRLQSWPRKKAEFSSYLQRSLTELSAAFGDRPLALDLASTRTDLDSEIKIDGAAELAILHDPTDGFRTWAEFVAATPHTPVYQWSTDPYIAASGWTRLANLGRGIVLRFRRSQGWNAAAFLSLPKHLLQGVNVLAVFDCDQISRTEDLTLLGALTQQIILDRMLALSQANASYVLMGSSFPVEFASIHPEYSKMEIRERRLHSMLSSSPPLVKAGVELWYGDHASVFADSKPPAFRGQPRVDLPSKLTWAYHRRKEENGYYIAANKIMEEAEWDNDLACWGYQEIRRAASGDLKGLNSGTPWTAIRISNHLHQQAHFGEGSGPIEEAWVD